MQERGNKAGFFTDNVFANGSNPLRMPDGTTLVRHAAEIPYETSSRFWQERNKILNPIRKNYQVVVIPPYERNVTEKIIKSDLEVFSAKNPIATMRQEIFPEKEDRLHIKNHNPLAKHIYLIASPTNKAHLADIQRVAWHVKNITQAEYVTAILAFLTGTRQDKNVDANGQYMASPINIFADIESLTRVDSFMATEDHSFAAQTAAATLEKPFYPATPWKFVLDQVIGKPIKLIDGTVTLNSTNTTMVRPDLGRNIAAIRAAEEYHLDSVSFEKKRLNAIKTVLDMPQEDRVRVREKMCIVYDDEFATAGTLSEIASKLQEYGARGLIVVGVHAKFTKDWETNILSPFIKKIYITDSRTPVGNIKPYIKNGKIEVLSLEKFVADIVQADVAGVNFWEDPNYCHTVLQSHGRKECK